MLLWKTTSSLSVGSDSETVRKLRRRVRRARPKLGKVSSTTKRDLVERAKGEPTAHLVKTRSNTSSNLC